jgi:predicted metal-dependent peptidase
MTAEEKQQLEQMINNAIELSSGKNYGDIPTRLLREFNELKHPTLNWKELLNEILSYELCDYSFSPPDRRYQADFFLPDFNEYDIKNEMVHFFIDTSGSINRRDLTNIISEINGALIQYDGKIKCSISYFDTDVYEGEEVKNTEELKAIKPTGGGGTSFVNLFKYIENLEEKPKCVIILTDGYSTFPKENYSLKYPVIWLLNSDDVTPPWGKFARYK